METAVDIGAVRAALERSAGRFAELLRRVPDGSAAVANCDWDVAEVATHVILTTEAYIGYAQGGTEPFVDVTDIPAGSLAKSSAANLAAEPERDLAALADRLTTATAALVKVTEARPSADPVSWNGRQSTLGEMLGILLGEVLLHGRDIAKAVGQAWAIDKGDARLVLASTMGLLPLLVNPEATAGVNASYDIRIRGGARVALRIHNGEATVTSADGSVDCHVSADPVAMLLVSYGRQSQWPPALTGKLLAWGRKPWLGMRMTRYLVTP